MKKVLITGANKGIGFETAKQLAGLGYFIYLGSRDLEKGKEAAALLNEAPAVAGRVQPIRIDVRDQSSVDAAREAVDSLDILINNAGISGGFPQPASAVTAEVARQVYETNVFGPIRVIGAFLDLLRRSAEPRIVNVTSGLASLTLHSDPSSRFYHIKGGAYGPSKSALNAYTIALAYELKDTPFKVNAVDPGYTGTDFNQHRGTGTVDKAARIIVKYATVGPDGPTGKYFSNDYPAEECPW